ncbi:dicarboxylate/amino acid:cation symporter [Marinicella sp. W31]|uniref:dicarboxylate/amino acid:cation symporter n=1 Tax=Marinicella sp. W31 TaxID=3023713 RepID=UPI0037572F23
MTLTKKIIIYMIMGMIIGTLINLTDLMRFAWVNNYVVYGLFEIIGTLFVNALKMMVVPLVFVSLFCGTTALREPRQLGSLGGRTVFMYLLTTGIALVIAVAVASLLGVGEGAVFPSNLEYQAKEGKTLIEVITGIVPQNPVDAMANTEMLAIIFFAIILALSALKAGQAGERIITFFQDFNEVIMKMVLLIMQVAPYAVFALLAKVFAELGIEAIKSLAGYFFTVLALLIFHGLVVYPIILKLFSGLSPLVFLKKMRSAVAFAFGTSSSNATIPVTLRTVTERMGVERSVGSFTIPFGATINMDGTAIMQGVATVFIANAYLDGGLTLLQMGTVIIMATVASIGSAGVPSAGIVMLQAVLVQMGLPTDALVIILSIDRLLDMTRTAVNITGDCAVTCIVAKSQGRMSQAIYYDPDSGDVKQDQQSEDVKMVQEN